MSEYDVLTQAQIVANRAQVKNAAMSWWDRGLKLAIKAAIHYYMRQKRWRKM